MDSLSNNQFSVVYKNVDTCTVGSNSISLISINSCRSNVNGRRVVLEPIVRKSVVYGPVDERTIYEKYDKYERLEYYLLKTYKNNVLDYYYKFYWLIYHRHKYVEICKKHLEFMSGPELDQIKKWIIYDNVYKLFKPSIERKLRAQDNFRLHCTKRSDIKFLSCRKTLHEIYQFKNCVDNIVYNNIPEIIVSDYDEEIRENQQSSPPVFRSRCKYCNSKFGLDCACEISTEPVEYNSSKYNQDFTARPYAYIVYLKNKIRRKIRDIRDNIYLFVKTPIIPGLVPIEDDYSEEWDLLLNDVVPSYDCILPGGMERGDEEGSSLAPDTAGNTILTRAREPEVSLDQGVARSWMSKTSNDIFSSISEYTDRWISLHNFAWDVNKSNTIGYELVKLELPVDLVSFCADNGISACVPFGVNAYGNYDMDISVSLTGNKLQCGMLQCSWMYQDDADSKFNDRINIATLSQTQTCYITAGAENPIIMHVPYKHSNPVVPTFASPLCANPNKIGVFRILVLNPLTTGTLCPSKLYGKVQVRFTRATFNGLRSAKVEAQAGVGEIVGTAIAMKALDTVMSDSNRDNPPVNGEPSYIVPTGTHSWCAGTGRVDVNKILRLDTRGQTRHPDPENGYDAFTVRNISQHFGWIETLRWSKNLGAGSHLKKSKNNTIFGYPCEPMIGLDVHSIKIQSGIVKNKYCIPPVGVVSSLFAYWRGSLRFKFIVCSAMMHSGMLLVAYVPAIKATQNLTMNQAMASPHIIIDIKEQAQFEFEIPYIAPTPWWPRSNSGNYEDANFIAPSRLYIYVYNHLVAPDAISDTVYINVFVSGGSDFEVSVPVQPSIGLSFDSGFQDKYSISPNDKPYYAGTWNKFNDSKYYVLRYQTTSVTVDGVSSWPAPVALNSDEAAYYICDSSTPGAAGQFKDKDGNMKTIQYGVLHKDPVNFWYMILCADSSSAQRLATLFEPPYSYAYNDSKCFVHYVEANADTTANTWANADITWSAVAFKIKRQAEDILLAQGEEVQHPPTLMTGRVLPSTAFGMEHFGENFDDLTNLCRRYHLYGTVQLGKAALNSKNQCAFWFTANPQGLPLDWKKCEVFNRLREGPIPLLLSGYRYFRGGLRFRLVFPQCRDTTIWVQHRPDRKSNPAQLVECVRATSGQGLLNHGYAMELQLANINSIIEIEVPFYQFSQYGLLQSPKSCGTLYDLQFGLGHIIIGIQACDEDKKNFSDKTCDIYYALADDFTCTQFQGFPPMIVLDELPEYVVAQNLIEEQDLPEPVEAQTLIDIDSLPERLCKGVYDEVKHLNYNYIEAIRRFKCLNVAEESLLLSAVAELNYRQDILYAKKEQLIMDYIIERNGMGLREKYLANLYNLKYVGNISLPFEYVSSVDGYKLYTKIIFDYSDNCVEFWRLNCSTRRFESFSPFHDLNPGRGYERYEKVFNDSISRHVDILLAHYIMAQLTIEASWAWIPSVAWKFWKSLAIYPRQCTMDKDVLRAMKSDKEFWRESHFEKQNIQPVAPRRIMVFDVPASVLRNQRNSRFEFVNINERNYIRQTRLSAQQIINMARRVTIPNYASMPPFLIEAQGPLINKVKEVKEKVTDVLSFCKKLKSNSACDHSRDLIKFNVESDSIDIITTVLEKEPVETIVSTDIQEVESQGIIDSISNSFKNKTDEVVNNVVDATKDSVKETVQETVDALTVCVNEAVEAVKGDENKNVTDSHKSVIINILTNFAHMAANGFNLKSVCISIVSALASIGVFAYEKVSEYVSKLSKILSVFWSKLTDKNNPTATPAAEADVVSPQGPVDEDVQTREACASWISLLFAGVCTVAGCVYGLPPKYMNSWIDLISGVGIVTRTINFVHTFIIKTFDLLKRIYRFVLCKTSSEYLLSCVFEKHERVLKAWSKESMMLTDPVYYDDHCSDKTYHDRVWYAYHFGQTIISKITADIKESSVFSQIFRLYDKLEKVRANLHKLGFDNHVRKMPCVFYIYGEPGLGKSYFNTELYKTMLKEQRFPVRDRDIVCTVSPLADFWQMCRRQPVLIVDDLFAVQTPECISKQLLLLFDVVTPQPLSPPKADLADKNMLYNPEIVIFNSNYKYNNINNVMDDAVNRRRDFLIEMRYKPYKTLENSTDLDPAYADCPHCIAGRKGEKILPSQMTREHARFVKDYHMVDFYVIPNVMFEDHKAVGPFTKEELLDYLTPKYLEQRLKSEEDYYARIRAVDDLVRDLRELRADDVFEDVVMGEDDNFATAYSKLVDTIKAEIESVQNRERNNERSRLKAFFGEWWTKMKQFEVPSMSVPKWLYRESKCRVVTPQGPSPSASQKKEDEEMQAELDRARSLAQTGIENVCVKSWDPTKFSARTIAYIHLVEEFAEKNPYIGKNFLNDLAKNVWKTNEDDLQKVLKFIITYQSSFRKKFNHARDMLDVMRSCEGINCVHVEVEMCELEWKPLTPEDTRHLYKRGNNTLPYDIVCEDAYCIMNSNIGQISFYYHLKKENTGMRLLILSKNFDLVPPFYRIHVADTTDWTDVWFKIKMKLIKMYKLIIKPAVLWSLGAIIVMGPIIAGIVTLLGIGSWFDAKAEGVKLVSTTKAAVLRQVGNMSNQAAVASSWLSSQGGTYGAGNVVGNPVVHGVSVASQGAQQVEVAVRLVKHNSIFIVAIVRGKTLSEFKFRCLIIRNRVAIVLLHFIEMIQNLYKMYGEDNVSLYIRYADNENRTPGLGIPFTLKDRDYECAMFEGMVDGEMLKWPSNFVTVQLPHEMPEGKNIIKFMSPTVELNNLAGDAILLETGENGTTKEHNVHMRARGRAHPWVDKDGNTREGRDIVLSPESAVGPITPVRMTEAWEYGVQGNGMCGSVLISRHSQTPIVGMHVAGDTKGNRTGIAEMMGRETFNANKLVSKVKYDDVDLPEMSFDNEATFKVETDIVIAGRVPIGFEHWESGKTQIVPSLIQGVVPVRTEPNPLSSRDKRLPRGCDPLVEGVKKHGILVKTFPETDLKRAFDHLMRVVRAGCKPIRSSVGFLDAQVVVCGDINVPEFEAMTWNTSAGYPLSHYKPTGCKGKKFLFDLELGNNGYILKGYHPRFKEHMCKQLALMKEGVKPCFVFTDCLKDTTLPIEKCSIPGKTRVFSTASVDLLFLFRSYFGDFMASYRRNRFSLNHSIGINVNSSEWNTLASKLLSKGTAIVTGDYSNFGPGLNARAAYYACRVMREWHKDYENPEVHEKRDKYREMLCESMICSLHLARDLLYYAPGGLPSGSPCTDIQNSLVNLLYIYVAWLVITGRDLTEFEENCYASVYGDDVIMSVSDKYKDIFNAVTISAFFAQYDIKFTDVDKKGEPVPYRSIFESTFLKRGFMPHPSRPFEMLAPLDEVSIEGVLNWVRNSCDLRSATLENCTQCLELAYSRGEKYFNAIKAKIEAALRVHNICDYFMFWYEIDCRVYDEGWVSKPLLAITAGQTVVQEDPEE